MDTCVSCSMAGTQRGRTSLSVLRLGHVGQGSPTHARQLSRDTGRPQPKGKADASMHVSEQREQTTGRLSTYVHTHLREVRIKTPGFNTGVSRVTARVWGTRSPPIPWVGGYTRKVLEPLGSHSDVSPKAERTLTLGPANPEVSGAPRQQNKVTYNVGTTGVNASQKCQLSGGSRVPTAQPVQTGECTCDGGSVASSHSWGLVTKAFGSLLRYLERFMSWSGCGLHMRSVYEALL